MKRILFFVSFLTGFITSAFTVPPVLNYAGQVAVNGEVFTGTGLFKFALVNSDGETSYWSNDGTSVNGSQPQASVSISVNGGLYSILLGNTAQQGMGAIDPAVFAQHTDAKLRVWFSDGVNGFQQLSPDRPFASVPYAFRAGSAQNVETLGKATVSRDMLAPDIRDDLNRSIISSDISPNTIAAHNLNEQILRHLKPEITSQPHVSENDSAGGFSLSVGAEGKYLSYQWKKDGQPLEGETLPNLSFPDHSAQNDGNYSVEVSNDFGTVDGGITVVLANGFPIHRVPSINMEMIWCPPGTFTMGSPPDEVGRDSDEMERNVTINSGFYLGKFELTQIQYETIMAGNDQGIAVNPSSFTGHNLPVERVSWKELEVFLDTLNRRERKKGRLRSGWRYDFPTEAEWEYACRAGTKTQYNWGNQIDHSLANYGEDLNETKEVGSYAANFWGFFDMHGNVFEWVFDRYTDQTGSLTAIDPIGAIKGHDRVIRGGGFQSEAVGLRSSERFFGVEADFYRGTGFRLAYKPVRQDVEPPSFSGPATVFHPLGFPYIDVEVEAHDLIDGNLTAQIERAGKVKIDSVGSFVLDYSVSDSSGNLQTAQRTVKVEGNYEVQAANNLEMIWCPAGSFSMGSPLTETGRYEDETQHAVNLNQGFYLGKFEVTQSQYQSVMTNNPDGLSPTPSYHQGADFPVEQVSWNDALTFLARLNDLERSAGRLPDGWEYSLPTEAEWEYACRAGTTTPYSWGGTITPAHANYGNILSSPSQVGSYPANPWGFHDMHGNVFEWVFDRFGNYAIDQANDPEGPAVGASRVLRGGSWTGTDDSLRSALRSFTSPGSRYGTVGFRLCLRKSRPDRKPPELSASTDLYYYAGFPISLPSVEAHDVRDGNLTTEVLVSGTVNSDSSGNYLLTYSATDSSGNKGTTYRTVTVVGNRTVDLNATVAMELIWCPPGTFTMGSPTTEAGRWTNETEHNVSLTKGFYLGKYEVTQAQYEAVMAGVTGDRNATPSHFRGYPNRPVEKVSWDDAQVFLTRLNEQQVGNLPTGWSYVLPTESQWEYACRAGTTTAYSWGNSITSTNANYNNNVGQTSNVGQYEANPWGFFDMHGNVWEWTADFYNATYPTGTPVIDPTGPKSGSSRVERGGSYALDDIGMFLRSAKRRSSSGHRRSFLGFRISLQKSQ